MTTSILLFAILISSGIGYLVVSLAMQNIPNEPAFSWWKIALGIGIGYGITSLLSFMWQATVGSFSILYPIFELTIAAVLFWKLKRNKRIPPLPASSLVDENSHWNMALKSFLAGGILLGGITFAIGTITAPNGMWDAWMVQNRAARFFYLGEEQWTNAFSPLLVSADYPLLAGMSIARLWRYAGQETFLGPALFAFTITAALIGFLIDTMARFRGSAFAAMGGLCLLTSSALFVFAPAQLADIPISFYLVATIVLLHIYEDNPSTHQPVLFLAGMTSALALWTKNEGWIFLFSIFPSYFVVLPILKQKKFQLAATAKFIMGLLPVFFIVMFFKLAFVPAHDFLRHQPEGFSILDYLFDPVRHVTVAGSYLIQSYDLTPDRSTPLLFLLLLILIFGIDRQNLSSKNHIAGFAVLLMTMIGEYLIYLITPNELQWQISSSIHRLFLQLWPVFVFETMMILKTPSFGKEQKPHRE